VQHKLFRVQELSKWIKRSNSLTESQLSFVMTLMTPRCPARFVKSKDAPSKQVNRLEEAVALLVLCRVSRKVVAALFVLTIPAPKTKMMRTVTMTISERTTTMKSTGLMLFVLSTNLLTKAQAVHHSKVVTVTMNSLACLTRNRASNQKMQQKNALLKDRFAQSAAHVSVAPTRYQWPCFVVFPLWFLLSV